MTAGGATPAAAASSPARRLEWAALVCILIVLTARPFMAEMPFRSSELSSAPTPDLPYRPPEELLRLASAMILLLAALLWAAARAIGPPGAIRGAAFGIGVAAFAAWSLWSALGAVDVRAALTGWLEQVAILLAAFVMLNLAGDRRKWALVVIVLAALAGMMGAKALFEVFVEIPERIAEFQSDPAGNLAIGGVKPGTPGARMFARRLMDPSALGYMALANVFASLLVMLTAAAGALAVEKIVAAVKRPRPKHTQPGEISLPMLAAAMTLILPLAGGAALVLTRSKGGIAAAVFSGALAAGIVLGRRVLTRHRRKLLALGAAAIVAGAALVAVTGLTRGGLPTRSMQIRWEYWAGAGGVIAESPLVGVGPGNFGNAYLRHRLPAAAESTKTAHNVLVDAACNYGLIGAAIYLALLVWIFVAMTRPAAGVGEGPPGRPRRALLIALLAATVPVVRTIVIGSADPFLILVEGVLPGLLMAALLTLGLWAGESLGADRLCGRWARVILGCGLAGFAVHNLVTFTLWTPGVATVFWVAAGALAGSAGGGWTFRPARPVRWVLVACILAGMAAAGTLLVRPVYRRTALVRAASRHVAYRRGREALEALAAAVDADRLDGIAPADLARFLMAHQPESDPVTFPPALVAAQTALARSRTALHADLLSRALGPAPAAADMAGEAVRLDPMNARLRMRYAELLIRHSRPDEAKAQLLRARDIDHALPANSDVRLDAEELRKLKELSAAVSQVG